MKKYLGEKVVNHANTVYKDFDKADWMIHFIEMYGGFDGSQHKDWVMDQVARIYNDTNVIIKLAKWDNGHEEYRISLDEPSKKYSVWVASMKAGEDGENTYSYYEGVAP